MALADDSKRIMKDEPVVDCVAIVSGAGDGTHLYSFAASGTAERKARSPVGHPPVIAPAIVTEPGARLDAPQRIARRIVNRIADDGALPAPRSCTLINQFNNQQDTFNEAIH